MEIRDEAVDRAEAKARRDDEVGLALALTNAAVGPNVRLEGAHRRRPDRDDPATRVASARHRGRSSGGNLERLGRDAVIADVFDLHGPKGSGPNVQQNLGDIDAGITKPRKERLGEVEACGRCGDAAGLVRIDGLVALAIGAARWAIDVWRQRDLPDALEPGRDLVRGTLEPNLTARVGFLGAGEDGELQAACGLDRVAGAQAAAGADETLPGTRATGTEKKYFSGAAAGTLGRNPRGKDPAAIDDEQVPGSQERGQVAEEVVLEASRLAIEKKKARSVSLGGRLLGDERSRKVEVEVVDLQKSLFWAAMGGGGTRPKC